MTQVAQSSFSHLFSPLTVGQHTLKNRVAQGALSSVFHDRHRVSQRHLDFYASRARGGAGMIVTESLAAHSQVASGTRVRAVDESNLDGLKKWADVVESQECRLIGQFVDPGRGRHHPGRHVRAVGASAFPDDLSWTVPRALTVDQIRRMINDFGVTAERLQRAGFSGVELSCGHGHLIHQFLSPQSNRRDDEYGGDRTRRSRIVRDIVSAIRGSCGAGFIIGLKLPGDDGVSGGISPDEAEPLVANFAASRAIDYMAIAQGAHHPISFEMHLPDRSYPRLAYREITRRMRSVAQGVPVFAVGRVTLPDEAEELLAAGDADAVMMARPFLADAEWVSKARDGRPDKIRPCISCNGCWEHIIEGKPVACVVNPRLGLPDEDKPLTRTETPRRVAIVGAGPAGLEAALTAASSGHEVTLFGDASNVGGSLALNARIPGCDQISRAVVFKENACRQAGVAFRLDRRVAARDILELKPDAVVLSAGATMRRPEEIGDFDPALVSDLRTVVKNLLSEPGTKRRGTAVVYDCDHTAGTYDATEFLQDRFDRVILVTPREAIARDVGLVIRQRIYRRLSRRRIPIVVLSEIMTAKGNAVSCRNIYTGDIETITDVSIVAYSTARAPNDELLAPLSNAGVSVELVGDCYAPRTLMEAVHEGYQAGIMISKMPVKEARPVN